MKNFNSGLLFDCNHCYGQHELTKSFIFIEDQSEAAAFIRSVALCCLFDVAVGRR